MLAQGVEAPPVTTIDNYNLGVLHQVTYLGSTITNNKSLYAEVNQRIGKAVTTTSQLTTHVWENPKLSTTTKMAMYNACIINTLLCSSEAWTTCAKQEQRLNSFHMCCLRRILNIKWSNNVPNTEVCNVRGFFDMDACKGICEARPKGLAPKETQQLLVTKSIHSIDELPCLQYTASFIIRYDANTAGLATKT